jgi:hypothetical protein
VSPYTLRHIVIDVDSMLTITQVNTHSFRLWNGHRITSIRDVSAERSDWGIMYSFLEENPGSSLNVVGFPAINSTPPVGFTSDGDYGPSWAAGFLPGSGEALAGVTTGVGIDYDLSVPERLTSRA